MPAIRSGHQTVTGHKALYRPAGRPNVPLSDGGTAAGWKLCSSLTSPSKQCDRCVAVWPPCTRPVPPRSVCLHISPSSGTNTGLSFDQSWLWTYRHAYHSSHHTASNRPAADQPSPDRCRFVQTTPQFLTPMAAVVDEEAAGIAPSPLQLFTRRQYVLTGGR